MPPFPNQPPAPPMGNAQGPSAMGGPQPTGIGTPTQANLFQRFGQLTEQEKDALDHGVTPEAARVIMKLVPELKPVLEDAIRGDGGDAGDDDSDQDAGGPDEDQGGDQNDDDDDEGDENAPLPPRRPTTRLGDI